MVAPWHVRWLTSPHILFHGVKAGLNLSKQRLSCKDFLLFYMKSTGGHSSVFLWCFTDLDLGSLPNWRHVSVTNLDKCLNDYKGTYTIWGLCRFACPYSPVIYLKFDLCKYQINISIALEQICLFSLLWNNLEKEFLTRVQEILNFFTFFILKGFLLYSHFKARDPNKTDPELKECENNYKD